MKKKPVQKACCNILDVDPVPFAPPTKPTILFSSSIQNRNLSFEIKNHSNILATYFSPSKDDKESGKALILHLANYGR